MILTFVKLVTSKFVLQFSTSTFDSHVLRIDAVRDFLLLEYHERFDVYFVDKPKRMRAKAKLIASSSLPKSSLENRRVRLCSCLSVGKRLIMSVGIPLIAMKLQSET